MLCGILPEGYSSMDFPATALASSGPGKSVAFWLQGNTLSFTCQHVVYPPMLSIGACLRMCQLSCIFRLLFAPQQNKHLFFVGLDPGLVKRIDA